MYLQVYDRPLPANVTLLAANATVWPLSQPPEVMYSPPPPIDNTTSNFTSSGGSNATAAEAAAALAAFEAVLAAAAALGRRRALFGADSAGGAIMHAAFPSLSLAPCSRGFSLRFSLLVGPVPTRDNSSARRLLRRRSRPTTLEADASYPSCGGLFNRLRPHRRGPNVRHNRAAGPGRGHRLRVCVQRAGRSFGDGFVRPAARGQTATRDVAAVSHAPLPLPSRSYNNQGPGAGIGFVSMTSDGAGGTAMGVLNDGGTAQFSLNGLADVSVLTAQAIQGACAAPRIDSAANE